MFDRLPFFSGEKKEAYEPIHPDFKIKGDTYDRSRNLRWQWNWDELKPSPQRERYAKSIKLAFPFDDPSLLDGCPFMCKIGENIGEIQETKYYGVAYATEEDLQVLAQWGQRFPHAKLIEDLESLSGQTTDESSTKYVKGKK